MLPILLFLLSVHLCVVPNSVYTPARALCAHYRALFESRERDQNFFVDVLCDGSLWHDNIKGNERHLGCVFSVFSCPGRGCYLWEFINNHARPRPVRGAGEDDFPQTFTLFPWACYNSF